MPDLLSVGEKKKTFFGMIQSQTKQDNEQAAKSEAALTMKSYLGYYQAERRGSH